MFKPYPSDSRYKVGQSGQVLGLHGQLLKPVARGTGYLCVSLAGNRTVDIHRMVAETHLGPCPENFQVNHKDGDKTNNHVLNLEYVTHQQNMDHAKDTGLLRARQGSQHGRAKLTEADIPVIRERCKSESQQTVADSFGVHQTLISDIVTGKRWQHVKDKS